jgi:hypothetical protein
MTGKTTQSDPAAWIRQRLQSPIYIDEATLDFLEAGFGVRDPAGLPELEGSEAASIMELLFYPDQQDRLAFEERWGGQLFSPMQADALVAEVVRRPVSTLIRMNPAAAMMSLQVPEYAIKSFIERLQLTWQPTSRLHDILNRALQGRHLVQVRSRLRHCRLDWHEGRLDFLEHFLNRIPAEADDFDACLDFLLDILSQFEPSQSPFDFLIAKKVFFFQALCQAESLQRRLRDSNMETLMLQGARIGMGDTSQWYAGMRLVDRICTALYGGTRFFLRPVDTRLEAGEAPGSPWGFPGPSNSD